MASYQQQPNFVADWRRLKARVAELERRMTGRAFEQIATVDSRVDVESGRIDSIVNPGAFIDATLVNGFTNHGSGRAPASYYEDDLGRVYLRGVVAPPAGGAPPPVTIFTLAADFRPPYIHSFPTQFEFADAVSFTLVEILPDGTVQASKGDVSFGSSVSLDSISFRT